MGPDGIQAAQARVGEIRGLLGLDGRQAQGGGASGTAFADVLAAQLQPTASPSAPVEGSSTVNEQGYANGLLPAEVLAPIGQSGDALAPNAARAFDAMKVAAADAGITLSVNDAYRGLDRQQQLAAQLGLYRDGGRAAVPGTSNHGWGLSVDIATGNGTLGWLRQHAGRYGFAEDVPGEPWHWTYRSDTSAT